MKIKVVCATDDSNCIVEERERIDQYQLKNVYPSYSSSEEDDDKFPVRWIILPQSAIQQMIQNHDIDILFGNMLITSTGYDHDSKMMSYKIMKYVDDHG